MRCLLILTLLFVCFISETECSHSKNKARNKNKLKFKSKSKAIRSETMPDFLAAIDKATIQARNSKGNSSQIYLVNRNRTNKTIIQRPYSNPDILVEHESSLNLVHRGWLKVSTPSFTQGKLYPKITLPNWNENDIPTERNFFRVNNAFSVFEMNENSPPGPFYFYMRLSKRNLFYGNSKDSIEIVGNIAFKDVRDAISLPNFARQDECFVVDDIKAQQWTLCAETVPKRNQWVCIIRDLLRKEDLQTCLKRLNADADVPEIVQHITQPIITIPLASPMCNEDYNYNELGADWECECREGKNMVNLN